VRLLSGVALLPLAASLVWCSAKSLALVAVRGSAAAPFTAGLGLTLAAWLVSRQLGAEAGAARWAARGARWFYVLGHELTHALAAWASGGKVFAISVAERGGHVDLSETSVLISLAPYCVPFHALAVIAAYRALLWLRPETQADALFLLLMGAALGFHALMTWGTLTETKQPDLDAAGGVVFSLAVIGAANGLMLLALLKALFPESVPLLARVREAGAGAWWFWTSAWRLVLPAGKSLWRRALA
jgi:hypothetical protein